MTLLHPGVYVNESPRGERAIGGVSTSVAIFVGDTARGPLTPTKLTSVAQFERLFGGHLRADAGGGAVRVTLRYAIEAFFRNGGGAAYVVRACSGVQPGAAVRSYSNANAVESQPLAASSVGAWGNSLRVLFTASSDGDANRFRVLVWVRELASGRLLLREDWDRLSLTAGDEREVASVLARSLYLEWRGGGFSLLDFVDEGTGHAGAPDAWVLGDDEGALSGGQGGDTSYPAARGSLAERLDMIDDAAVLVGASDRWLASASPPDDGELLERFTALRDYVDARPARDLFLVADLPSQAQRSSTAEAIAATREFADNLAHSEMVAVYWPHIQVADPVGAGARASVLLPAAGAVAGVYARIDARRGIWKAPAGVEANLAGTAGLGWLLTDKHQDDLNPKGVNVLRVIADAGPVVWGARTFAPAGEWRYVSVRRTAMYLRKSIHASIQWSVFEPNGERLWSALRTSITSFMLAQHRKGAFVGASSREAFLVKVDAETTSEADRAAGIVNIVVGFAPVRPAEFVIVELSQKTATSLG